ncbi:MAG: 16S rRNA processing protein RimM [Clostridia bacterium]|nr:16S rRNA processing protein RimM [Clostridia bacterium]
MYSEYLSIGEVLKPQGIHGEVKVRPDTDDPARFALLETVFILKNDQYTPIKIEHVSVRADGFVYCILNGATTREEAESQRGIELFVDREHAVSLPDGAYFISDLLGCSVCTQSGETVGTIKDVLQPGANDVYEIKCTDGKLMYLPVLPFVILSVDVRQGTVIIDETKLSEVAVYED